MPGCMHKTLINPSFGFPRDMDGNVTEVVIQTLECYWLWLSPSFFFPSLCRILLAAETTQFLAARLAKWESPHG